MTYRVRFAGGAAVRFHTLPKAARDALIERTVDVAERPWDNSDVQAPSDDPRFRETDFDSGQGILAFYVDEEAQLIRIFDIVWMG